MEGGTNNLQQVVRQVSEFNGKKADNFLEWSSKLRVSLSLYHKSIFNIVQGLQRSSELENDKKRPLVTLWIRNITLCTVSFTSLHSTQLSLSCKGLRKRRERREQGTNKTHGQLYVKSSMAALARPCGRHT